MQQLFGPLNGGGCLWRTWSKFVPRARSRLLRPCSSSRPNESLARRERPCSRCASRRSRLRPLSSDSPAWSLSTGGRAARGAPSGPPRRRRRKATRARRSRTDHRLATAVPRSRLPRLRRPLWREVSRARARPRPLPGRRAARQAATTLCRSSPRTEPERHLAWAPFPQLRPGRMPGPAGSGPPRAHSRSSSSPR